MPFNGGGGTSQPAGSIYPATANTLIESAKANTSIADLYTMLAGVICKDGQTTTTQRIPFAAGASMGSQTITAVADGTATTHAATVAQVRNGAPTLLGTVAGTNTITAALTPALAAYASGNKFILVPANTNTGATTLNIDSVGAKSIFWNGAACVGGELRANIPALVEYDGTQFHIVGNGFNAPFLDTHAIVEGSADSTKKVRLEVDGLTTATTRVLTMPDFDVNVGITGLTEDTTPDYINDFLATYDASATGLKKVSLARSQAPNRAYAEVATGGSAFTSTTIPADDTIPQITEGVELITVSITPRLSTSRVRLRFSGQWYHDQAAGTLKVAMFRNAVTDAIFARAEDNENSAGWKSVFSFEYEDAPATTSAVTYSIRIATNAGNLYFNGTATRLFGGVSKITLVAEEITL